MQTFFYKFFGFFCVLLLFFFFSQQVVAGGWVQQESPVTLTLYALDKYSDSLYAVGSSGIILYSSDQGKNWTQTETQVTFDLFDIDTASASKATAVGEEGVILYTTNSGGTWQRIFPTLSDDSYEDSDLYEVKMADKNIGYIVGRVGLVLKTSDGGASWKEINQITANNLFGLSTISTSELWVVGENGDILHSEDGGTVWETQDAETNRDLYAVDFINSNYGFAVGEDGAFLTTADGGEEWDSLEVEQIDDDETIKDVDFYDENHGIIEGSDGTHLITSDGGISWTEYELDKVAAFRSVVFYDENNRFVVGDVGVIYRYDGGAPDKPTGLAIEDGSPTADATPTFTWEAADDDQSSVSYYEVKIDSDSYDSAGDYLSYTSPGILSDGVHTVYLRSVDEAGNTSSEASLNFTVDSDDNDSFGPTVSSATPRTAIEDFSVVIHADVSEDAVDCDFYIDGANKKNMTIRDGRAVVDYTFSENDSYSVYVKCSDVDGNAVGGTAVTLVVSDPPATAQPGDLIKMTCGETVYVNDPCTAVYYYGADGKRHAFPNETVYKLWYDDYDDLVLLSSTAMADIPLGSNVIYRPAERLIKFSTNSVYAVSYGGVLRPIANAEIAAAIFGDDWVEQIDIVNDVFFGNYDIGQTVESSRDFDEDAVGSSVSDINDIL